MRVEPVQNTPIFVIGNPRSGTTLLRLMLTAHPNIGIPPESGWLVELYNKYHQQELAGNMVEDFVDDLLGVPKIEEWQLDREGLLARLQCLGPISYGAAADQIYRFYLEKQGLKIRWGDKNNYYLNHIEKLVTLFPEAQFLHIVRDGRDVACSYRDLAQETGRYAPTLPSGICEAALHWTKNVNRIEKSFARIDSRGSFTIRYEDLVNDPEATLKRVCDFLGEDFDDSMLTFDELNKSENLEPEIYMSWKALTRHPLTTARVGRWQREMFLEDQFLFGLVANRTLRAYGYERAAISPLFSISKLYLRGYALLSRGTWHGQAMLRKTRRGLTLLKRKAAND